jgi:hypothetical protein
MRNEAMAQYLKRASKKEMMRVRVGYGSKTGDIVWIDSHDLEVRTNYGRCYDKSKAIEELSQDAGGMSANMLRSTLTCAVGLGQGTIGAAEHFIHSIPGLASGGARLIQEIGRRNIDAFLAIGSKEARDRLAAAGARDEEGLKSAMAVAANALPYIKAYLYGQYQYFRDLPPPEQTRFLCRFLGAVSFEVLLHAGSSESIKFLEKATPAVAAKFTIALGSAVKGGPRAVSAKAVKEVEEIAHKVAKLSASVGEAGVSGATGAIAAKAFVSDLLRTVRDRCGANPAAQPFSCLGLPATATDAQIDNAHGKMIKQLDDAHSSASETEKGHLEEAKKGVDKAHAAAKAAH